MSLSILNSVSSLVAENSLAQASLGQQKALQELSTGLKINSSADDAAGLAISAGLQANTTALAQSYANANNGISFLQVADGALSQVNSLLNRAVTLATESASGNLTGQQRAATNAEYQSILTEINQIGATTQFNGSQVFTDGTNSAIGLSNSGTALSGTIALADTISGSLTLTTTVPGDPGVTQSITPQDDGFASVATITPGAVLTGGLTINSTTSGSNAVTSDVNVVNNSDGSVFIPINDPTDPLSGSLTLSTVVPGTSGAAQGISLANSSSGTLIGSIDPSDTLSGTLSVTSTTFATGGVQSAISLASGSGNTTITGTIPPADSLGGSVTITSTIPQSGGVSSAVTLANGASITGNIVNGNTLTGSATFTSTTAGSGGVSSGVTLSNNGATITGNITPGDTVSGSVTVTSTIPSHYGTPQSVTFTSSGTGATEAITSSVITAGDQLSGSLVIDSVIGPNSATDTINLANYQNLSSSNSAIATAAANQLASDMTTAIGGVSGSTYTASISGGVLTIKTSNPVVSGAANSLALVASGNKLTSAPLVTGDTLGGYFDFTTSLGGHVENWTGLAEQGLTSSNPATVAATLASLTNKLNSSPLVKGTTGSTYTATINSSKELVITSSNVNESFTVAPDYYDGIYYTDGSPTQTNNGEALSVGGGTNTAEAPLIATANTPTNITLNNVATTNLASTLQSQLGSNYAVSYNNSTGALSIGISSTGNTAGISTIAESSSSIQQKTPVIAPVVTPTVVNLNGITSANLLTTLQSVLNSAIYSVNYVSSTGALTVSLTGAAQSAGTTISSTTNNLQQTTPAVAAQVTPVTVNLTGVSTSSLQTKLSTALGSNYTVAYDTGSGALNISISSTGTAAGVKTIAFSGSPTQTTPIVGGTNVTKNVDLTGVTASNLLTTLQNDLGAGYNVTYDTNSGALNISAVAGGTTLSANSGTAQETGPGSPEVDTPTNIDLTGQTGATLANYLSNQLSPWNYTVTQDSNGVTVSPMWWDQMLYGIQSVKATNVQAYETTPAVQPVTTPTNINLTGVATSNLQQTIQNALGSDYGVFYDTNAGFLEIYLNDWGNPNGPSSFTSSSTLQQNTGSSAAVVTPSTINLTGVSPTNLASSIVSQLGSAAGNYDVSYDTSSGALSIALSAAGALAGITSISSDTSGFIETAPAGTTGLSAVNIFTSDATVNGSTSLDVTVGSLTTANLGTSNGSAGTDLSGSDLLSQSGATASLTMINTAISDISSQRGAVGANINRLAATASDIGTEQLNLTSATNSILNADIGKTVANMTQYNILQSTGMASLQQANQAQRAVLKLLQ
jgi:flagellin